MQELLIGKTIAECIDDLIFDTNKKEKHTILLVDDEENNLQLLKRTLRGKYQILSAKDGTEALEIVEKEGKEISLIVSDQRMPEMSGTEFLKITDEKYPDIIKILLTGNTDIDIIVDAINDCHLFQYLQKPFEPEDLKNVIQNGIAKFELANGKNVILDDLKELFYKTITSISTTLDAKDPYTHGHSMRVTLYSLMLAKALNIDESYFEELEIAGLLHDIGKIAIPQNILCKPGKLSDDEFKIMSSHPYQGKKMLENIKKLHNVIKWVESHHEKWNGRGYPAKLAGENIPEIARIIAIADTYDAMTSTRSYRKALAHEVAIEEIKNCSGSQFDPIFAAKFIEIEAIIKQAQQDPDKFYEQYTTLKAKKE